VHRGVAMVQKWVAELKRNTGRSLEEWVKLIKKDGPADEAGRRDWLKSAHKLGTNSAVWLASRACGKGEEDSDPAVNYVEAQYSGARAALRPIYDQLHTVGRSLGADVKACPCKMIVPLYRAHVFAQIKPATNSRIDLGLCLIGHKGKLPKRVIDTGGLAKKDRITHRIEIKNLPEIDGDLEKSLKIAYELDV
jgi:Domain of unknown function (DUF5655)/Domain of unknown function (DUF4287)